MAGLNKVTVEDINVKGRKVLVRVDFNVPMKDGAITNDNRIQAALPTINKLVENGAKVVLCSHLGKPKNGPEAKFSLAPAAKRLSELVNTKVTFAADDTVVGDNAKKAVAAKKPAAKKAAPAKKAAAAKKPAAKKAPAKKAAVKKLGKIFIEIDGKQIDFKAIEKKAAKLGGDVYVVANEKKIFGADGKSVNLF